MTASPIDRFKNATRTGMIVVKPRGGDGHLMLCEQRCEHYVTCFHEDRAATVWFRCNTALEIAATKRRETASCVDGTAFACAIRHEGSRVDTDDTACHIKRTA